MATIINTPGNTSGNDNGAGWSVAIIILIILIGLGAYFLLYHRGVPAPASNGGANINVTLPSGGTGGTGGATGGTGTGTGGATTP